MNTDLNIYHELERRNLTHSRRHASRELFGGADNYLCIRGDRGPSERALIHLFQKVWRQHPLLALRLAKRILWGAQLHG